MSEDESMILSRSMSTMEIPISTILKFERTVFMIYTGTNLPYNSDFKSLFTNSNI